MARISNYERNKYAAKELMLSDKIASLDTVDNLINKMANFIGNLPAKERLAVVYLTDSALKIARGKLRKRGLEAGNK